MFKFITLPILGLALAFGMGACKKAESTDHEGRDHGAAAVRNFVITGEVLGFQQSGQVILLKHEKIEGLMDAMTMGFELADPKLGAAFKKGDKVTGNLRHGADAYVITELKKL